MDRSEDGRTYDQAARARVGGCERRLDAHRNPARLGLAILEIVFSGGGAALGIDTFWRRVYAVTVQAAWLIRTNPSCTGWFRRRPSCFSFRSSSHAQGRIETGADDEVVGLADLPARLARL